MVKIEKEKEKRAKSGQSLKWGSIISMLVAAASSTSSQLSPQRYSLTDLGDSGLTQSSADYTVGSEEGIYFNYSSTYYISHIDYKLTNQVSTFLSIFSWEKQQNIP